MGAGLLVLLGTGTTLASGDASKLVSEAEVWHWNHCSEPRVQVFASDESRQLLHVLGRAEKATQDPRLLYWQGLIASCAGQAEQGKKQLELFLAMAQGAYPRLEGRARYDLGFRQNSCEAALAAAEKLVSLNEAPLQDHLRHFAALRCTGSCDAPEAMLATAQKIVTIAPDVPLAIETLLDASICSERCVTIVESYRRFQSAGGDVGPYKARFEDCSSEVVSFKLPQCMDEMQVGLRDQDGGLKPLAWGDEVLTEATNHLEFSLPGHRAPRTGKVPRFTQPLQSLTTQMVVVPPAVMVLSGEESSAYTLSFPSEEGSARNRVSLRAHAKPSTLLVPVAADGKVQVTVNVPGIGAANGALPFGSCEIRKVKFDFTSLPGASSRVAQQQSIRSLVGPLAAGGASLGSGIAFAAAGLSSAPPLAAMYSAAADAGSIKDYETANFGRNVHETRLAVGLSVGGALLTGGVAILVHAIKESVQARKAQATQLSRLQEPVDLTQVVSVEVIPEAKHSAESAAKTPQRKRGSDGQQVAYNNGGDQGQRSVSRPSSDRRATSNSEASENEGSRKAAEVVARIPKDPVSGGTIRATQVEAAAGEYRAVLSADLIGHADSLQAHYRLVGGSWKTHLMVMKDVVVPAEGGEILNEEWTTIVRLKGAEQKAPELEYYVLVSSRGQEFAIGTRRSPKKLLLQSAP
jgi:hypothetical protein